MLSIRVSSCLLSLVSAIAVSLPAVPALGEDEIETWYVERIATGDVPFHLEHYWSKGNLMRSDSVLGGLPVVTIVTPTHYIMIDRLSARGVSIERSERARAQDRKRTRMFGNEGEELLKIGAELVSTEKYGVGECQLYRDTNADGRREVCLTTDEPHLPLYVRTWHRAGNKHVSMRYLNWTKNLTIPDDFFQPDPRVHLETVTYEEYIVRKDKEPLTPFPPFFRELLHGKPND